MTSLPRNPLLPPSAEVRPIHFTLKWVGLRGDSGRAQAASLAGVQSICMAWSLLQPWHASLVPPTPPPAPVSTPAAPLRFFCLFQAHRTFSSLHKLLLCLKQSSLHYTQQPTCIECLPGARPRVKRLASIHAYRHHDLLRRKPGWPMPCSISAPSSLDISFPDPSAGGLLCAARGLGVPAVFPSSQCIGILTFHIYAPPEDRNPTLVPSLSSAPGSGTAHTWWLRTEEP